MMNFLFGTLLLLMSSLSYGQFSNQQKQYFQMDNLLSNPGLENGKSGWTCAAGTFTADASGKLDGGLSGKVVLSAQTLDCSITVSTNAALQAAGAVILQAIKTSVAGVKVCPIVDSVTDTTCADYDGSNILKEVAPLYPLFGATNIGLRIKTDSAVTGTVYFDGSKVGRLSAASVPGFAQAQVYGTISHPGGGGSCGFDVSSTTVTTIGDGSGCNAATVTGKISVATNRPWAPILPAGSPAGTYVISWGGYMRSNGGVGSYSSWRATDGTTNTQLRTIGVITTTPALTNSFSDISFSFKYDAPLASATTINLQCGGSTSAGCSMGSSTAGSGIELRVLYFPPASLIMSNYIPWKVDVNIGGADPSLGTVDVASYAEIANGSLDMVLNTGSAAVQIPCSSTNASSGLTCSAGNESVGVYIPSLPFPGEFKVCAYATHFSATATAGVNEVAFQLVQTTNSTQTIVQEGKTRIESYTYAGASTVEATNPVTNCGNFIFTDTSAKTIRLMYEQDVTGTVSTSSLRADRSAAVGQRDIHITVEPVTPFMIASVTDMVKSTGTNRGAEIQSVYFGSSADCTTQCTTGNCTICHQTGSKITSVSYVTTGTYDINGIDGTKYECNGSGTGANNVAITHRRSVSSSTKARVIGGDSTAQNMGNASVICFGLP